MSKILINSLRLILIAFITSFYFLLNISPEIFGIVLGGTIFIILAKLFYKAKKDSITRLINLMLPIMSIVFIFSKINPSPYLLLFLFALTNIYILEFFAEIEDIKTIKYSATFSIVSSLPFLYYTIVLKLSILPVNLILVSIMPVIIHIIIAYIYSIRDELEVTKSICESVQDVNKQVIDRQMEQMLESKTIAVSEMSDNLAKQITTPLSQIKKSLQSLKDFLTKLLEKNITLKNQIFTFLDSTDIEIKNMLDLLSRLEQISYANDKKDLKRTVIFVEKIFDAVTKLNRQKLSILNINFEIDNIYPETKVKANLDAIVQVFNIIILNAIDAKHVSRDNRILIKTASLPNQIVITIKNNGVKIANESKDRIFAPFFTTKDTALAAGLGLTIAKKIITNHQGKIRLIKSEESETIFEVILPVLT